MRNEIHLDPTSPVLAQDKCYHNDGIDYQRWSQTVTFPLSLVNEESAFVIEDRDAFFDHLRAIEACGREAGVVALRTRVLSRIRPTEETAVLCTIRDRLSSDGRVLGSTSMTWNIVLIDNSWKISQIHFNDYMMDSSIVTQVFTNWRSRFFGVHSE